MKKISTVLVSCVLLAVGVLLFTPLSMVYAQLPSKPLLWLRSDVGIKTSGTNVVSWSDVNDTSKIFFVPVGAGSPTVVQTGFNGHPAIALDGATQYLEGPSIFPVANDYTIFIVSKIGDITKTNNIFSGNGHAIWLGGGRYANVFHGNFSTVAVAAVPFGDTSMIQTIKFRQSNMIASNYINAVEADSNLIGANPDSTIFIGAFQRGNFFAGSIAEIILYKSFLSKQDQDSVEHYLQNRYAIAAPIIAPEGNVVFGEIPAPMQLYPRGANDSAVVPISGLIKLPNIDSIYVDLFKSNFLVSHFQKKLSYEGNITHFSFGISIQAEPSEYRFVVGLKKTGWDSVVAIRDSIVSGDVILICGQSNSIFGSGSEIFRNQYCRTFGNNYSHSRGDTLWTYSNVAQNGGGANVGEWGLILQKMLLEKNHIPTLVINGGVGGTPIESHLRNDANPTMLSTIYGSMYYRVQKANVLTAPRMIFWYQGESNAPTNYYNNFKTLYNSWKKDYPSLEKFYVMQIHTGCSNANASQVREILRTLPDSLPNIVGHTPFGIPGHDGCHYDINGYHNIGGQLYKLLARDFYSSSDTVAISAPNIKEAFYTDSAHQTICLVFAPKESIIQIPNDTTISGIAASIRDYFYVGNDTSSIAYITTNGSNAVFLHLKKSSQATTITYLPDVNYNRTSTIYEGPWLLNQRGIGAFSFWNVPLAQQPPLSVRSGSTTFENIHIEFIKNTSNQRPTIRMQVLEPTQIRLVICDILGREVRELNNSRLNIGEYLYPTDKLPSVSFLRVITPNGTETLKFIP